MSPDQEHNMQKVACTTEDLFCGKRCPQKSDICLAYNCLRPHWIGNIIFSAPERTIKLIT